MPFSTGNSFFDQLVIIHPITSACILALVVIWIYVNQWLVPIDAVSFNYDSMSVWRCVL